MFAKSSFIASPQKKRNRALFLSAVSDVLLLCHSRTTRQKIASEKQFLTQITRALVCEQATAKRNKRYVSGDRSDLSSRQANLGARTQSLIRESRPIIWPYNFLDPRVYSFGLRPSGTRMTEKKKDSGLRPSGTRMTKEKRVRGCKFPTTLVPWLRALARAAAEGKDVPVSLERRRKNTRGGRKIVRGRQILFIAIKDCMAVQPFLTPAAASGCEK